MNKLFISVFITTLLFYGAYMNKIPFVHAKGTPEKQKISSLESSFLDQIGQTDFDPVQPEQEAYMIRWNFQDEKDFVYDYTQKMDFRQRPFGAGGGPTSAILNAKLEVKSKGNRQADLVFSEPTMEMKMNGRTMKQNMPSFRLKNMNQKGRVDGNGGKVPLQSKILIKHLFPVPNEKIKKGQTVRIKQQFPLRIQTLKTTAKGYSDITYTGMVKIDGDRCLQLDVNTNVSKLNLPDDKQGEYEVNLSGKSRYFFNLEKGAFQRGSQALLMAWIVDAPSSDFGSKEKGRAEKNGRVKRKMVLDYLIQFQLRDINDFKGQ